MFAHDLCHSQIEYFRSAMISDRYRTMDNMMAFHDSVNLIVNIKNIEDVGKILSRGITDNQLFYNVYRESLKETGRN